MAGTLVTDAIKTGTGIIIPRLIQTVHTQTGAVQTGTTLIPQDDTIPQNTEGFEVMTVTITPTNINSILEIESHAYCGSTAANQITMALFQDSTANALATAFGLYQDIVSAGLPVHLKHRMAAGTTGATTFKIRIGCPTANTTTFNGFGGVRHYGGTLASFLTVTEYLGQG